MRIHKPNIAESKRARLANIAQAKGYDFDLLLLLYLEERLLYRISQSSFGNHIVLKGGLLLYSIFGQTARPTRDIDVLARDLPAEPVSLAKLFLAVLEVECPDGVSFDPSTIEAQSIREGANYQGVRLSIVGNLGKARKRIQLDFGFHDVVIPEPITTDYPVLLDDPAPSVTVYSLESVIAEKFEAMVSLGSVNSRMKDFYDIYLLALTHDFSGEVLSQAVSQTLLRRKTVCPQPLIVFTQEFAGDPGRQKLWQPFLHGVAGSGRARCGEGG